MCFLVPTAGRLAALCVLAVAVSLPARAELAQPTGEQVLRIDGAISQTNTDGAALFDIEMLQALPAGEFTTATQWTEGDKTFKGVPLKALLDSVGASGNKITATALNNYSVEIPLDALKDDVPIVAYSIDGETFSRRDKGPLWIVFPYDRGAEYQTELVYGWSIWQLATLTVSE
jgi:hypothetical protein